MRRALLSTALLIVAGCSPSPPPSPVPGRPRPTPAHSPPIEPAKRSMVVAVGDIACAPGEPVTLFTCHHAGTAALLGRGAPLGGERVAAVLLLGDIQYEQGTAAEYRAFDRTWGRVLGRSGARILPVAGNHEYGSAGPPTPGCRLESEGTHACGFAGYFQGWTELLDDGDAQYVLTLGGDGRRQLVVLVLDTGRCDADPSACDPSGPVVRAAQTLLSDPRSNPPNACTIVAWHHPRWSELGHGDLSWIDALWRALFTAPPPQRPDLVLNGHDHLYERYPRLGPDGEPARDGIAEIIVGTGGKEVVGAPVRVPLGNLAAIDTSNFGVLRIDWGRVHGGLITSLVTEHGQVLDRVTHPCHA